MNLSTLVNINAKTNHTNFATYLHALGCQEVP